MYVSLCAGGGGGVTHCTVCNPTYPTRTQYVVWCHELESLPVHHRQKVITANVFRAWVRFVKEEALRQYEGEKKARLQYHRYIHTYIHIYPLTHTYTHLPPHTHTHTHTHTLTPHTPFQGPSTVSVPWLAQVCAPVPRREDERAKKS